MFSIALDESEGVSSLTVAPVSNSGKQSHEISVQCQPASCHDVSAETEARVEAETQTEPPARLTAAVSDVELHAFLSRVIPLVQSALFENSNCRAFDGFQVQWEEERSTVAKLFTIGHTSEEKKPQEYATSCTAVSWNANGSLIASSYGQADHAGWCGHRSYISVWNTLTRSSMQRNQPERKLELACCVVSLQFHPQRPSILAAGTFNGTICVWDLAKPDDEPIACSVIDDYFHREPISNLVWVSDIAGKSFNLASISGDGCVLVWSLANNLTFPELGFCITPTRQYHGQGDAMNKSPILGGTALCFSNDNSTYVVGTEGGGVLRCLLNRNSDLPLRSKTDSIQDGDCRYSAAAYRILQNIAPVYKLEVKKVIEKYARLNGVKEIQPSHIFAARPEAVKLFPNASHFAFEPHAGSVTAISFSPFHRNVFLSASSDGSVRLSCTLQADPVLLFEPSSLSPPVTDVAWSPARPLVFAVVDQHGNVFVYDLLERTRDPVLSVHSASSTALPNPSSKALNIALSTVRFSPHDASLLAAGDVAGQIHIYQLSSRLSKIQPMEQRLLSSIGSGDASELIRGNADASV